MTLSIVSILFVGLWIVCGFFAYGLTYAHFQKNERWSSIHEETEEDDFRFALLMGYLGLIGFLAALGFSEWRKYDMQWKRNKYDN